MNEASTSHLTGFRSLERVLKRLARARPQAQTSSTVLASSKSYDSLNIKNNSEIMSIPEIREIGIDKVPIKAILE